MFNISIARWKGRILAAFQKMLGSNRLQLNMTGIPDDKWPAMFFALSQRLGSPKQKDWCMKLMAKSAMVFCQTVDPNGKFSVNDPNEINEGKREVEYWFRKDNSNWGDEILADVDYIPVIEQGKLKRRKRRKIVLISILSTVAVIIAACVIYNLPYFAERRAFADVEKEPVGYNIDYYIFNYPHGAHIEEVMRYQEDWYFQLVKNYWDEQDAIMTLNRIDNYLAEYPEGRYVDTVKDLYNQAWDFLIDKYSQSVGNSLSTPGYAYMHDMLVYMKEHNVRTVKVVGHPRFNLKEFTEYPSEIQRLTILFNDDENGQFRFPRDLHTIKDQISVKMAEQWTDDIVKKLNHEFDNLFGYEFIKFVSEGNDDTVDNCPTVEVTYVINNQETGGMPDVWTYTETQGTRVVDGGLYLGIALDFTADFTLPDSNINYKVNVVGDPGDMSFNGIDASQLYNSMCDRCLNTFANTIETSLGLATNDD